MGTLNFPTVFYSNQNRLFQTPPYVTKVAAPELVEVDIPKRRHTQT